MTPQDIHQRVLRRFIWTNDEEQYGVWEHWTSHADAIERDEIIRDDCDGFAMTCAELAVRAGIEKSLVRLATCFVETGSYHCVAIVSGWVLDNRQRFIIPWNSLPYRWDRSMKLSDPGVWRKMEGTP